jgi:hypothetical protein
MAIIMTIIIKYNRYKNTIPKNDKNINKY